MVETKAYFTVFIKSSAQTVFQYFGFPSVAFLSLSLSPLLLTFFHFIQYENVIYNMFRRKERSNTLALGNGISWKEFLEWFGPVKMPAVYRSTSWNIFIFMYTNATGAVGHHSVFSEVNISCLCVDSLPEPSPVRFPSACAKTMILPQDIFYFI